MKRGILGYKSVELKYYRLRRTIHLKCSNCNNERKIKFISKNYKTNEGKQVTVHGVPASICECDTYVSISTMLLIDKYLNEHHIVKEDLSYVYFDSINI